MPTSSLLTQAKIQVFKCNAILASFLFRSKQVPRFPVFINTQRLAKLRLVSPARGRSGLPRGLNRCFEGFVSSRNSLPIIFDREKSLGAILRQFAWKTVDDLVKSSFLNNPIVYLQNLQSQHSLQSRTKPSFDRSNHSQLLYSILAACIDFHCDSF